MSTGNLSDRLRQMTHFTVATKKPLYNLGFKKQNLTNKQTKNNIADTIFSQTSQRALPSLEEGVLPLDVGHLT